MLTRRGFAGLFATTMLTSGGLARSAAAQAPSPQAPSPPAWPTRHVRLIVPFVPGGAADAIARVVGNRLSEAWGQQVVVENRGGAGANIGAQVAAGSDPDGYTLYITSVPHATNRFLYPSLNYDPIADFAPVTLICTQSNIMVVPNSSPSPRLACPVTIRRHGSRSSCRPRRRPRSSTRCTRTPSPRSPSRRSEPSSMRLASWWWALRRNNSGRILRPRWSGGRPSSRRPTSRSANDHPSPRDRARRSGGTRPKSRRPDVRADFVRAGFAGAELA